MGKGIYCLAFNTSYGWLTLYATNKGIKEIKFGKWGDKNSDKAKSSILYELKEDILCYLEGKKGGRKSFEYTLDAKFSDFQLKLFKALKKNVSYGETISYKELADKIKSSPRACGQALGSNPLPIIIPCHRVIQKNGELGGFGGGIKWKQALINLEKS
ncbi:MAG: methylated-DNA--[protein]-cysteine S-methyltransferase [bacterium]|nr:methylated-DNA--[protein]-cysteine S-methyltransferase [bacterium]